MTDIDGLNPYILYGLFYDLGMNIILLQQSHAFDLDLRAKRQRSNTNTSPRLSKTRGIVSKECTM